MGHAGVSLINPYMVFEKVALSPGMRVADFGCGRTGHFVFPAARTVGEKGIVYAVDILKDVLENIKSRSRSEGYDNVHTVWSDIESVGKASIPDDSLDGIFMVNVLSLIREKKGVFEEAARLIRLGGFFAIIEWSKKLGLIGPPQDKLVTPAAIVAEGGGAGFLNADQFEMGDYHYGLIFKKNI